ncbi:leucine-rich repeat-containing protein 27-like isoform X1 [Euwallacea fornicatus]|uniref:leucine-rich repeat-containing protein 27-like isoform X1 n=1 Tax=Euwallacea fornicatus TaxID=995702 RepID=UPI00338F108D
MSTLELILDYSKSYLTEIPVTILDMVNLKMLFLEQNSLIKLPDGFFHRLPNLTWLDLRSNQLQELPKSVANHEHLEHLLLTNNNISALPNELGSVPNLKALQVADNPLIYPPKKIVQKGTNSIKNFLKEKYDIECANKVEEQRKAIAAQEELKRELQEKQRAVTEVQEEKLIKVHEETSEILPLERGSKASRDYLYSARRLNNSTMTHTQNTLSGLHGPKPTLRVNRMKYSSKKPKETLKIVHNVSKSESKISLKSFFQKPRLKTNFEQIPENVLKEEWLNKLKALLNDQERILQQEKNLRALSTWRQKKPATQKPFHDKDTVSTTSDPPYATYSEYARIPSRSELASQLENFLKEREVNRNSRQSPEINFDRIINNLMEQLKEMETHYHMAKSPRSEMEEAGKQILTIADIHKKLLQLKSANNRSRL